LGLELLLKEGRLLRETRPGMLGCALQEVQRR